MTTKSLFLHLVAAVLLSVSIFYVGPVYSAGERIIQTAPVGIQQAKPVVPALLTAQPVRLPDPSVSSVTFAYPPKQGDRIGYTTIFNITIKNLGPVESQATKLIITCTAIEGGTKTSVLATCPKELNGARAVKALAPKGSAGDSTGFPWPDASESKWPAGKFRLVFELYPATVGKDSDKTNNSKTLEILVPATPAKIVSQIESVALQPIIKPKPAEPPKPTSIVPPPLAVLKKPVIEEVTGQKLPIKPEIAKPLQVAPTKTILTGKLEAPITGNEIVRKLPEKGPPLSYGPIVVSPGTPKIDDDIVVYIKVTNDDKKTDYTLPHLFTRCSPLDGGSCPGGRPGQEIVTDHAVGIIHKGGDSRDVNFFGKPQIGVKGHQGFSYSAGKYRLSVAIDKGFISKVTPDKEMTVVPTKLIIWTLDEPVFEAVSSKKVFSIYGDGIIAGGKVVFRETSLNKQWEATFEFDAALRKGAKHRIKGDIPSTVSSTPGIYEVWVTNPDTRESNRLKLEVRPALLGLAKIDSFEPKVVRWDKGKEYKKDIKYMLGTYHAQIALKGSGLTRQAFNGAEVYVFGEGRRGKVEYSLNPDPQSVTLNLVSVAEINNHDFSLIPFSLDGFNLIIQFSDGAKKGQIYTIPCEIAPQSLLPPTIIIPANGAKFGNQDVPILIEQPVGVLKRSFTLEWQYVLPVEKRVDPNYSSISLEVLPSIDQGKVMRATTVMVPIQKFLMDGIYRFRVKVAETPGRPANNKWSDWREIEIFRPSLPKN